MADYDPTDPAFLAANSRGVLDPAQRVLLREHAFWSTGGFFFSLISTVPLALMVGAGLGLWAAGLLPPRPDWRGAGAGLGALAALIAVARLRLTGWPDIAAWRDLLAGRVLTAPGRIVSDGASYRPLIDGAPADFLDLTWTAYLAPRSLWPGTYTFYYLPFSHRVIAAAPGERAPAAEAAPQLLSAAAAALHFRAEDLLLNRAGRLAADQRWRLLRMAGLRAVLAAGVAALIWSQVSDGILEEWIGWVIAGLMAGTGVWLVVRMVQMVYDTAVGTVASVTGLARKGYQPGSSVGGSLPRFTWTVGGDPPFDVPRAAYDALVAGERYCVYYTPAARVIVGVEPPR